MQSFNLLNELIYKWGLINQINIPEHAFVVVWAFMKTVLDQNSIAVYCKDTEEVA